MQIHDSTYQEDTLQMIRIRLTLIKADILRVVTPRVRVTGDTYLCEECDGALAAVEHMLKRINELEAK